jgi:polyhydroxybutyrate depolymerase
MSRALTALLLLCAACVAAPPVTTGTEDGGAPAVDAGERPDAGGEPKDAGEAPDAGAVDAGYVPPAVLSERPYRLVVPVGYSPATPVPLVVLLHGFALTSASQDAWFGFSDEAQARTFLLALPEGTSTLTGQQFWNATDGCCAAGAEVDDVGYLSAVIADVKAKYAVDGRKVFLVGHSNGGFMAHAFACARAEEVSAIVSFAGANWADAARCTPSRPVSVVQLHGTADAVVFYAGGFAPRGTGPYPSAAQTVATWAAKNGCTGTQLQPLGGKLDLAADVPFDETAREAYDGCPTDGAVERWTAWGMSHAPLVTSGFASTLVSWLFAHARP